MTANRGRSRQDDARDPQMLQNCSGEREFVVERKQLAATPRKRICANGYSYVPSEPERLVFGR